MTGSGGHLWVQQGVDNMGGKSLLSFVQLYPVTMQASQDQQWNCCQQNMGRGGLTKSGVVNGLRGGRRQRSVCWVISLGLHADGI